MIKAELVEDGILGNDLRVVNAAKVSFDRASEWVISSDGTKSLSEKDKSLIGYLARGCTKSEWVDLRNEIVRVSVELNTKRYLSDVDSRDDSIRLENELDDLLFYIKRMPTHWTPFSHCYITLRETVPIFVARQRFKHTVGFTYNEASRRYVTDDPEFYIPETWRAKAENVKQGSDYNNSIEYLAIREKDGEVIACVDIDAEYRNYIYESDEMYDTMLANKVAPEQARMVLPQSMMTSYYVTGSLYSFARAYNLRRDRKHAQGEIADLADQWDTIIRPHFPVSWEALTR